MGQGLALALSRAGAEVALLARRRHPVAEPLVLDEGSWPAVTRGASLVLVATPDAAISETAATLAGQNAIGPEQVVLHLSGLLDWRALESLAPTGAGLGSFHPLQTISDPAAAPALFLGAYAAVEGDSRAMDAGDAMAGMLGMHPVRVAGAGKPAYHAGAVFASNFVVALAAVAERLARAAGVPGTEAGRLYLPLLKGAVANLDEGPVAALTGPIARGDVATVGAHLAALGPDDRRLYRCLGLVTVTLAERAGLSGPSAAAIRDLLAGGD
jgi:predicted short-subunit dehydrogenase-like oxidoreductase (DUF2520 family)